MSSDLNACELESANSMMIYSSPELKCARNISEDAGESYYASVDACPTESELLNTGWLEFTSKCRYIPSNIIKLSFF